MYYHEKTDPLSLNEFALTPDRDVLPGLALDGS
jgi:hypothetical protein